MHLASRFVLACAKSMVMQHAWNGIPYLQMGWYTMDGASMIYFSKDCNSLGVEHPIKAKALQQES